MRAGRGPGAGGRGSRPAQISSNPCQRAARRHGPHPPPAARRPGLLVHGLRRPPRGAPSAGLACTVCVPSGCDPSAHRAQAVDQGTLPAQCGPHSAPCLASGCQPVCAQPACVAGGWTCHRSATPSPRADLAALRRLCMPALQPVAWRGAPGSVAGSAGKPCTAAAAWWTCARLRVTQHTCGWPKLHSSAAATASAAG